MLHRPRIVHLNFMAITLMAAVTYSLVVPEQRRGLAASRSPRYVVSYLVSGAQDLPAVVADEAFPDPRFPTHPWHWRVFDPASGRDTLFLALESFPTRVRWDPDYRFVEYAVANRIERADWRLGARPEEQVRLPVDSCLCDFWSDAAGRWHVVTQREVEEHPTPGYVRYRQFATRWDQEADGTWRAAAGDSALDPYGGCLDWKQMAGSVARPPAVMLGDLLDSMRIGYHRYSILREVPAHDDEDLGVWVWIPSDFDPAIGLEMAVETGDSDHAMAPVVWVDRGSGRRRTVCARGDTDDDSFGQVAFAQHREFLMVAAEYSGAHPIVADMRTGRVVFREPRLSARAVWVPGPRSSD